MPLINKKGGNLLIPITASLLAIVGVLFIYSASSYNALIDYGDAFYYVKKQAIAVAFGIIVMLAVSLIDYTRLRKWGLPLLIVSGIMLVLVFVPGVSVEKYGAKRWIGVGGFTVQPSEIAKFAYILFCADYISKNKEKVRELKGVLPIIISDIILCVLIILEPNMSVTVCFAVLMIGFVYLSGLKTKYFIMLLAPALVLGVALVLVEPYRLSRLSAFLDPWASPKGEGYQLIQSLYALGSGGLFGVGLGNSRQKLKFLPFSESDFILSVIGEETGFFGVLILFLAVLLLVFMCIDTALKCDDLFGRYFALGVALIYSVQVAVNALVVSGSIPPTGIPLPLISSGSTSIVAYMAAFGAVYGISKGQTR